MKQLPGWASLSKVAEPTLFWRRQRSRGWKPEIEGQVWRT